MSRQVQRVLRPGLRPERQAQDPEGHVPRPEDEGGDQRALLDAVAREGCDRDRLPRPAAGLGRVGEQAPSSVPTARGAGDPGASPAVAMRGITKRFPGVLANDAVDFEAAAGEVHALLGENGAGKSTLSNILTGLYRPDEGEIELYGEPVHVPHAARRARRRDLHGAPALPARAAVHRRRERRARRPPARGPPVPRSTARDRAPRRRARRALLGSPSTRARGSGSSRSASSSASRS